MTENTSFKDWVLRAIAALGLVAILLLGAWGIIQIAFYLPSFFSNIASNTPSLTPAPAQESVAVTLPSTATSGQAFTASWNHQNGSGNYSYAVSYSCANGLSMQAPVPTGSYETVPCNTPFNYTNATQNMPLVPTLTAGTQQAVTTISVAADNLSTGAITTTGSSTLTILPATVTTPAPTPITTPAQPTNATTNTYVAAPKPVTLYGLPDLSVRIISLTPTNNRYSLEFVIQNDGTNVTSAGWTFNVLLPLSPSYTYSSQPQRALYPGDKIVYTLGFTMPNTAPYGIVYPNQYEQPAAANCGYVQDYTYNGIVNYPHGHTYTCSTNYNYNNYTTQYPYGGNYSNGVVSITVDPQNYVDELSKVNNTANATLGEY